MSEERVSIEQYPAYDKRERKRIKYLITMYHYLSNLDSTSFYKRQTIEALKWCLDQLKTIDDKPHDMISASHLAALIDRYDWYVKRPNKNGFQLQEMGAIGWLIEEFGDERKPCGGKNSNVCVAEGCFNQSCLRLVGKS